jgi:hypothetical protein
LLLIAAGLAVFVAARTPGSRKSEKVAYFSALHGFEILVILLLSFASD